MITARDDFDSATLLIDRIMNRNAQLPQQVFRGRVSAFHVLELDYLWSEDWFRNAQYLTAAAGDDTFLLSVINPDPVSYYYANFGKFPLLRFTTSDSPSKYVRSLHEDPGESPADAVVHNAQTVVVLPSSLRWAVHGDRDLEIAIVAAMDEEIAVIIDAAKSFPLFTIADALHRLLPAVYRGPVPDGVSAALLRNYGIQSELA